MKKKSIYYLIIGITLSGITLLLYYCRNDNPIPENNSSINSFNTTKMDLQKNNNENIILTADEEHKFNVLKSSFDKINLIYTTAISKNKENINAPNPNKKENKNKEILQKITSKYPNFSEWLSNNPQKKKELANVFDSAYNLLENKRSIHANNRTLEQYISDGIDCAFNNACINNTDNDKKYGYSYKINNRDIYNNVITTFFKDILKKITIEDTNEEILRALKENLTNEIVNSPLYILRNWK